MMAEQPEALAKEPLSPAFGETIDGQNIANGESSY